MTREAIEVRDVNNEITEYVDEDEAERQQTLKSKKHPKQKEYRNTDRRTQKKRDRFAEIDQTLREISHDAMSHCGDHTWFVYANESVAQSPKRPIKMPSMSISV